MSKKILFVVIVILVFLAFNAYEIYDNITLEQYKHTVIKVAGDEKFPPYEYVDNEKTYTGFNVDIMNAIASRMEVHIKFYPMSWDDACKKLENGEIDVIQGMKYTKERDKYYDFSKEYLENSQSIFVRADNNDIADFEDLSSKAVVIQQEDIVENNLKELNNVNIIYTKNQEDALHELLSGQVDAYIGNTLTGVYLINKMEAEDKIKLVGETLNSTKYCMAVKNGDKEILNIINKGLRNIEKNGTYDRIYRKWFGRTVDHTRQYVYKILLFLSILIIIFIIIVFMFYRWNATLKKEVARQTSKLNSANEILVKKNMQIKYERDFREWILNSIFSGVVTINQEGIITFSNKLADNILNTKQSMEGKRYSDTVISKIYFSDKLMQHKGEKEVLINGNKIYLSYKISTLNSINGENKDTIIIFRDVTEEKLLQDNIMRKDKLQSLGNLIAGIAHEIRNPLTSIKTYTELIPKKFDNPRFREMISKDIPIEIDRLNDLITNLLEYSKPRRPFKEFVKLNNSVDSVMLFLKDKINKENIIFENNISEDIYIYVDKNQFRQVFINLMLNSIESLDKESKKIIISAKKLDKIISLSIQDNGCGIDEDSLNEIFNPFYTTKANGTGLGLFIVYQLLLENDVQIRFETVLGIGTKVIMDFKKLEIDNHGKIINS